VEACWQQCEAGVSLHQPAPGMSHVLYTVDANDDDDDDDDDNIKAIHPSSTPSCIG